MAPKQLGVKQEVAKDVVIKTEGGKTIVLRVEHSIGQVLSVREFHNAIYYKQSKALEWWRTYYDDTL
eukprot:7525026-Lingulodinium_polyedra.AAC.1